MGTCRSVAWRGDVQLHSQFLTANIQWLDPPKVESYVRRWYLAVEVGQGGTAEAATAKAEHLLDALERAGRQRYTLREMAENPLLLGAICLVHYAGERLPEKRARLYDECISFLLETYAEKSGRPSLKKGPARQVLQPLAWAMQERQTKLLSGDDARAAIATIYPQVQGLDVTLEEFLRRAREDCGLLTGSVVDEYEFLHLSFQEYFAAAHAQADGRVEQLADRIGESNWRETILLAMSMAGVFAPFMRRVVANRALAANRAFLRECFDEAERVNPDPLVETLTADADAKEVAAVFELFRGRSIGVVEAAAKAFVDHVEPGLRALAREVAGMPTVVTEGRAPSVDVDLPPTIAGIEWVWVPASSFLMGSSKTPGEPNYDPDAYEDETTLCASPAAMRSVGTR